MPDNLSTIENIRKMLSSDNLISGGDYKPLQGEKNLDDLLNDLFLPANGLFLQWEKGA